MSLVELVRLEGERARKGVERIYDSPVYRLRGKLLPLVHINEVLGMCAKPTWNRSETELINIVVLRADGHEFGLVVDAVGTRKKSSSSRWKLLKGIESYAERRLWGTAKSPSFLMSWDWPDMPA
ncbi:MAG: chemotaxis protein CheW [Planctomycetaceae bacterium]